MDMIAWMIVASEVGFWVVIAAGLVTRYIFKKKKAGLFLLALTPVIDLILLVATSVHLWTGATATIAHAIAAVYIGVSIAFGKSMIEWADVRFQYYITKEGPRPQKLSGIPHAKHYFKSWLQHVLAYVIGAAFLVSLIFLIGDPSRTEALSSALKLWTVVLGIDFLIAASHFIWPKK
ncbi:hypothetical protein SAMN04487936_10772 [Halobacillus dabanensis]|uniref:Uncharacterized protein n=1 Tax=Halobacillus dabanensis TaxID=240302 RepID=A0A1I3WQD5_HALDA|nr:hypothetical protein [Halobacillus dabanensis]SFK09389.1 hypothetical protein SAMN04487936_10772 [Halobacillus dabanensis]